jgi:serine/threonine protein kinase
MSSENGSSGGPSSELAELIDGLAARLQAGEVVDIEAAAREHPSHAEELRKLLPALGALDELSRSGNTGVSDSATPDAELPSGVLGDFRIVREVGRGGMGVVYEAEQISLGRRVALKVLPFAATMDSRQLHRFKNEAHAAAQLHHTNIVPVYAVGCERGVHFYAMQYIEGQSLADVITELRRAPRSESSKGLVPAKDVSAEESGRAAPDGSDNPPAEATTAYTPPPAGCASASTKPFAALSTVRSTKDATHFRAVAELGIQAAEALDFAHKRGVIHRDIKPANLLVDADARIWVTDFGLAQVQGDAWMTMTGDLVGTLRYMSPEQALAKRVVVDHRTDIYSLGATLYELLTLEPAYRGNDRQELLRQISFEEPRPPRRLNKAIAPELETIVLKAMEKNAVERYATAQELADDLRRFVMDEPIRAQRPSWAIQARKWLRRHPAVLKSAVGMLLLTVVGLTLGTYVVWKEKTRKEDALELAEAKKNQAIDFRDRALSALRDLTDDVVQNQMARDSTMTEERKAFLRKIIKHYEGLSATTTDDAESRAIRAEGYYRVGIMRYRLGELADAETAYRDALDLEKQLAVEFPNRTAFRQSLATTHNDLATLLFYKKGQLADAETAYREALALFKQLAAECPNSPEFRLGLAKTHSNLGNLLRRTGGLAQAETAYREALALFKQLAAEFPDQPEMRHNLALMLVNVAGLCSGRDDFRAAKEYLKEARPHHEAALKANPRHPEYREVYQFNLLVMVPTQAGLLDPAAAVQAAEQRRDVGWNPPTDAYKAACALALCIRTVANDPKQKIGNDAGLDTAKRQAAVQSYGDAAMKMLQNAVAKGFKDAARMKKDKDLDSLRAREDFRTLLRKLDGETLATPALVPPPKVLPAK